MKENATAKSLVKEENRSLKFFLILFYVISIGYDAFYYYFTPLYINPSYKIGYPEKGHLGIWTHIIQFAILPLAFYLVKNHKIFSIKYLYFYTYLILSTINDMLNFYYSGAFENGNIVELIIILFSPIFVNKHFFWTVSIGIIGKYGIEGLVIQDTTVLIPIIILSTLSAAAYILLSRFHSYTLTISESEKQLRTLMNALPDSVVLKDEAGHWVEANKKTIEFFSIDSHFYKGKTDQELAENSFHYKSIFENAEHTDHLLGHDKLEVTFEKTVMDMEGTEQTYEITTVPMFKEDGQRKGTIVVTRDITERKKTEELLVQSEKLSAVGELAAGLSHEIKNPLTSLKGFTQMMKAKAVGDDVFHLSIMESELERIQSIVNEFLMLAKPQKTNYQENNLEELFQHVIFLLKTQASSQNITINYEQDETVSPVHCDGNQLKQVFINIIKNATEAMPNGGNIDISIKKREDHTLIRIKDDGTGIPQDVLSKLGEPFYTTKETGTGLGLMICFRIIEQHNGNISIESEEGNGTTFEIELPVM
ncbi:ATP-binding protein [Bacillus taeanensis]|uniref:histidine kinase n=1 Tax=Bacillus taeanensis TaxID=273032 RepID=A0A366XW69_9BACI|nr:ATP-binding protein [Bacillus taeanensis]RBW68191.1 PAS domain-containing sensor histidine kinase [Bacillus taeanensis]